MPNEDGFEPGQPVTFDDIMRARQRVYSGTLPSRDDIAAMKKADVVEWLEAHGVAGATGPVVDLRRKLVEIMYMEA